MDSGSSNANRWVRLGRVTMVKVGESCALLRVPQVLRTTVERSLSKVRKLCAADGISVLFDLPILVGKEHQEAPAAAFRRAAGRRPSPLRTE